MPVEMHVLLQWFLPSHKNPTCPTFCDEQMWSIAIKSATQFYALLSCFNMCRLSAAASFSLPGSEFVGGASGDVLLPDFGALSFTAPQDPNSLKNVIMQAGSPSPKNKAATATDNAHSVRSKIHVLVGRGVTTMYQGVY